MKTSGLCVRARDASLKKASFWIALEKRIDLAESPKEEITKHIPRLKETALRAVGDEIYRREGGREREREGGREGEVPLRPAPA